MSILPQQDGRVIHVKIRHIWIVKKMIRVMNWLIDNIYVKFGDQVVRQVIGTPMGTDCAPFLVNLFSYSYEYQWINKQRIKNNQK